MCCYIMCYVLPVFVCMKNEEKERERERKQEERMRMREREKAVIG